MDSVSSGCDTVFFDRCSGRMYTKMNRDKMTVADAICLIIGTVLLLIMICSNIFK